MTGAEFKKSLPGKTARFDGGTIMVFGDGTVQVRGSNSLDVWKLHVIRPGLISYLFKDNTKEPTLVAVNDDLKSAQYWCWWGTPAPPCSACGRWPIPASVRSWMHGSTGAAWLTNTFTPPAPPMKSRFKEWRIAISRISVEDDKLRNNETFREELK